MDSIPSPMNSPPTFNSYEASNLYSPLTNLETSEPSSEESEQHFTRSRLPTTAATNLDSITTTKLEGSNVTQNTFRSNDYVPYKPFKSLNTTHSQMPPTPSSASTSDESQSRSPSPEYTSIPSFVNPDSYLPSDDPDSSSSDEDNPKPIRPPTYSRDGKLRPKPKYYYDSNFDPANSNNNNQKRKNRRGGYKGIPVFEPTEEDFMGADGVEGGGFYDYVKRIEKYGMRSGVVKVIPPKSWIDSLPSVSAPLRTIRLKEPISQHILGSQGLYRVTNVAKTRIWNPAQWKSLAEEEKYTGPNFAEDNKKGERSERSTRGSKSGPSVKKVVTNKKGKGKKVDVVVEAVELERNDDMEVDEKVEDEEKAMEADIEDGDGTEANGITTPARRDPTSSTSIPTPSPRHSISMDSSIAADIPIEQAPVAESTSLAAEEAILTLSDIPEAQALPHTSTRSQTQPQTPASAQKKTKRPSNMQRAEPTEEEWQQFMSTFDELPHGMKVEDYTIEMMREVEKKYWRTLTFGEPAMYGADMAGSLFDNTTTAWNVAHLGDLLPRLAPKACKIPGVVSPYLYFGMWRATFAWHVEDADLYSINYIHFGAPKFWYAVPQEMSAKFERTMEGLFPTDRSNCPQFLRHKSFLASPRVLASSGIVLNRVVQLPGEFILTYPKGYHSGFNLGFNCAESVNFATEQWLPLGKVAKSCVCIGDSVNINVDAWLHHAALDEEKEDAKNPNSELAISRRKRSVPAESPEAIIQIPIEVVAGEVEDVAPPAKKRRKSRVAIKLIQEEAVIEVMVAKSSPKAKATKLLKVIVQKPEKFVCALCPDMSKDGLVVIGEPDVVRGDLAAHRVCVLFTPATWIEIDPVDGKEIVRGFAGIEKARWKLKCHFCPEKHGTKVQCMKGKCPRAYHATCALQDDSGALVTFEQPQDEPVNVSKDPETSTEGEATKTLMLCKQHNPDHQRLEKERKERQLEDRVKSIPIGSRITVKTTGSSFDVNFVAVLSEKSSISFTYDTGVSGEVKWKMIVFPDSPEVAEKKAIAAAKAKEQDVYIYDKPQQVNRRTSSIASPIVSISSLPHVVEARAAAGPFSKVKGTPIRPSPVAPQQLPRSVPQQSPRDQYQQSSHHTLPPHLQQSHPVYQTSHGHASQQQTSYSQSHLSNLQHQEVLQSHYATSRYQYQQPSSQRPQFQQQQQQQHQQEQQQQPQHKQEQGQHIRAIAYSQSQPQAWPHTLPQQSFDYSRTMQYQSQRHSLDNSGLSQMHYQSEQSQSRPLPSYQSQPQQQSQHSYGYPSLPTYQHSQSMNSSYSQQGRDSSQPYDLAPIRRGLGQIPYPQQPINYTRLPGQNYRSSGSM